MKLLIVESPAKAKTINKYLGSDYKVIASIGHIRDLPKSNKKAIDIEAGFVPNYEISKGKEKVVAEIQGLAKKASEVILATDPDREGEAIAWHIAKILEQSFGKIKSQNTNLKIQRVAYHEITKEAVEEALKHPRKIDQNLRQAQEARRVLDRLVGYDLSGLIWKKVRYGLSAGRVQSPALRIIMEKEREIRNFKPENFWVIQANLISHPNPSPFKGEGQDKGWGEVIFTCSVEPKLDKEATEIVEKGKKANWQVSEIEETEVKRSPRPPFITSTLQQSASTRLGFTPAKTMAIAQKLYEAGHITYMRTDSANLSQNAINQIKKVVGVKFGEKEFQIRLFAKKSKNAQEAHEAIRPTNIQKEMAGSTDEQKKLYNLIWSRAVASQMKDALVLRTKITTKTDSDIPSFSANGQRVIYDGWLKADTRARSEDIELPKMKKDDSLKLVDINSEGKTTEPPGRYSEAGLIKELEKRGIGRPSTYASIIKTLIDREYVIKDGKALKPTDTGDVVSSFLEQNFIEYINDSFTAKMEDELDDIADGKAEYKETIEHFYNPLHKEIKAKEKTAKITNLGEADSKWKCPVCESEMIIKLGKNGKFLSCERFPDCEGARKIDGGLIKEAESIGIDPETGLPIFVMDGRFGPYVQLGPAKIENSKSKNSNTKEKTKKIKPKRASIPAGKDPENITLEEALKYLSLPRELGRHPETGEMISANIGRFGPYIVHQSDFRSIKPARHASQGDAGGTDDVYTITLDRALKILKEPKKFGRRGRTKKKV